MTARAVIVAILATALGLGALMYWLQVYAFYREEDLAAAGPVTVALRDGGTEEPFVISFEAIDKDSSPIGFRSCFNLDLDPAALDARAVPYERPTPLVAPRWFECFDARAIGEGIEGGEYRTYLSVRGLRPGIDRVVAIRDDGQVGYAWNQIDPCGPLATGRARPLDCPTPEAT